MSNTQLRLRRGTTAEHANFTGAQGELTVDTDKNALVLHDGATQGGIQMARESAANVLDYGAVGDGSTNDTSAIQAAINSGAKEVLFPGGTYKITAPITIPSNIKIKGVGYSAWKPHSIYTPSPISTGQITEIQVTNHTAFDISGTTNVVIEGFGFLSTTSTTSNYATDAEYTTGSIGVLATGSSSFRIRDVSFLGLEYGLAVSPNNEDGKSTQWLLDGYIAIECKSGVRVGNSSSSAFKAADFQVANCLISQHVNKHIEVYYSDGIRLENCRFFQGNDVGVDIYDTPYVTLNGVNVFETASNGFRFTRCKKLSGSSVQAVKSGGYKATTPWYAATGIALDTCEDVAIQGFIERPGGKALYISNSRNVNINMAIAQPYYTTSMLSTSGANGCIDIVTSTSVNLNCSLDTYSSNNIYSVTSDFASMDEITGSISSNDYANVSRAYNLVPDKLLISHVMEADQLVNAASSIVVKTQRVFVPNGKSLVSRSTHFSSGSPDFVARVGANFWTTGNVANADGGSSNFVKKTLVTNSTGSDAYYDIALSIYNNSASPATLVQGTKIFLSMGLE